MRRIVPFVVVTLAAFLLSTRWTHRPAPVVLLSIDGLRPDYVLRASELGLRIPNLRRFLTDGIYARRVTPVVPSLTYPGHTTLVTGVAPERHGILGNRTFDPMGRNADGWYWYAEDIRATTLWDAARRAGLVTASVDWPVTVGAGISYNLVQYWRAPDSSDDAKLIRALSTQGLLEEAERVVGRPSRGRAGSVEEDERRGGLCAYLQGAHHPSLELCYLSALDEIQHSTEPGSPEALAVLERLDAVVGRVRDAADQASGGRAVLAVVSDHGFLRTNRELDLNEALRRAGLLQLDTAGGVRGWRAFAWGQGGSASLVLRDDGDREARQRLRAVLGSLSVGRSAPIARIEETPARVSGSPGASFTVFLAPDTRLVDARSGFVTRAAAVAGDHGHDPALPAMSATFLMAGRGIPRGLALDRIDLADVAPTLAALLELPLPDTDGRNLLAKGAALSSGARRSPHDRDIEHVAFR